MKGADRSQDIKLVRECLAGSQTAWNEFYCRYISLLRCIVRRHFRYHVQDLEDMTQTVFASLVSSLPSYDAQYALDTFVSTVAQRACIQEYRYASSAKRYGGADPIDLHDCSEEGTKAVASEIDSQEDQVAQSQLIEILRQGLSHLDEKCRELLRLRYYDEQPYQEISKALDIPRNTLAVQVLRCVDRLRELFHELSGKKVRP